MSCSACVIRSRISWMDVGNGGTQTLSLTNPQRKKLTLHCNHRSGHLKTEHTENLLLQRHLWNWPRGHAVSMRSELLVAHEKLGHNFFIHFENRTILLCMPCIFNFFFLTLVLLNFKSSFGLSHPAKFSAQTALYDRPKVTNVWQTVPCVVHTAVCSPFVSLTQRHV
jgi:hypothetical protein